MTDGIPARDAPGPEVYAGSPLTAVNAGGAQDAAGLGLVLGRPGIGKTALLVHLGLDALLRGRQVLHVALRDTVDHARAHCDEVLRAVVERTRLVDAPLRVERGRMIHSFAGTAGAARPFDPTVLERNLVLLAEAAQFSPAVVLVDGLALGDPDREALGALPVLAELARSRGIRVWATVRVDEGHDLEGLGGDVAAMLAWADVAIRVTAQGASSRGAIHARRIDAAGGPLVALDPSTMLVADPEVTRTEHGTAGPNERRGVGARDCTLYSGGAAGAEAAFGEAAERWGAHEVNFTFEGHLQARVRGRYELSPKELAVGDVSLAYVSKRLNRNYNDKGGLIRGVLQTLWHMVSRSQQVFVVGEIQEDGTVVGGTGWSVELARMWSRDLWVFDQARGGWFRWDGLGWTSGVPRITAMHLCGTGTRYLSPPGRAAIDELFARSFGEAG